MASSKKRKISYKCPFCTKKYLRENLPRHLDDVHKEEIPEGFSPLRYTFHYINKRPLDYHGRCTECKGPTPWDEEIGRYKRQCGKQACHDSYVKKFEENMIKKTGHMRNTDTEEGLQNMLKNRKISGKYKFQNGKEKEYVGSYEKNCLEFMDKVMNIDPDDIMSPGPTLEYQYDGKTHYYITDFYYVPYNLIIEVKDGGKNPNNRNMPEYREKQIAKEKFIVNNTDYNYLRLTDNNLAQLLAVFADLKMQLVDESNDRVVHINESAKVNYKVYEINDPEVLDLLKKDSYCKKYLDYISKNTGSLIVDTDNNKIIGYSFIGKNSDKGFIATIEVHKSYRRQGFGDILVDDAIKKHDAIDLLVLKSNKPAISLYKKHDFVIIDDSVKANGKPAYWMKHKSKLTSKDKVITEGYVINQKDILYNKDKFESGEINLCFVTGHSGSGKSTYTYKYAEDRNYKGVDVFSLDDLQWSYKYSDENLKEYGELAYKFFNGEGKRFRIPYRIEKNGKMVGPNGDDVIEWFKSNGFIKDDPSKNTFYQDSTQAFIKFTIKYAKSHKNTKYIIEGIQLFLFIEPSEVKDYAVYIKGTSALISTIRGTKRDSMGNSIKDFIDNMDTFFRRIKDVIGINNYETKINKWRKYFTDLEKKEAVRESKLAAIKENGFAPVDFI